MAQIAPQGARIPPDVPADPSISTQLTHYLRTFALWCRNGFAEQLRNNVALPGIMLLASDTPPGTPPKVYILHVSSTGVLSTTLMDLGKPKEARSS